MSETRSSRKTSSLFERVVEKSGVAYMSLDGTKLRSMKELRRYCSLLGYDLNESEFDFSKSGKTHGKKNNNAQKSTPTSTSSKLKVKLPSSKSTSKDIADDVKAIREALNMNADVSVKKKKAAPQTNKRGRRALHAEPTSNGREESLENNKRRTPAEEMSDSASESRPMMGNMSPETYFAGHLDSASSSDASFRSPTGRPMRQRKPNQRYTDLLSETEDGRQRRRTSSKHSTTSTDEDVLTSSEFFEERSPPPPEKKSKMKKTTTKTPPIFLPMLQPTILLKPQKAKKQKEPEPPRVKRKYTKRAKPPPTNDEIVEPPALIKGEFEQPPEFVEILQERQPTPVEDEEIERNANDETTGDDNLPPILPISAHSIQRGERPLSPPPRRSPAARQTPLDAAITQQSNVFSAPPTNILPVSSNISPVPMSILSIPSSLLTSSGELDFSQFTTPGDESLSTSFGESSAAKSKKRPKKQPSSIKDSILINQKLLSLGEFTPTVLTGSQARTILIEKPPTKRRISSKKQQTSSRALQQEAERSMRLETEEALQGIKVSSVQINPDGVRTLVDLPKGGGGNKPGRRGRFSANAAAGPPRFLDELNEEGDFNHHSLPPTPNVHRRSHPRMQHSYFDESSKFCPLPPEVAGDHCYGKTQPTAPAAIDPAAGYSETPGSSEKSNTQQHSSNLTKVGHHPRSRGGRPPQIVRNRLSPSPPPSYNDHIIHGLSPSYMNDPNLGAYYGAMDVDVSGSSMSSSTNQVQNMLTAKLPANLMDDDSDASEHVTRVDIQ